MLEAPIPKDSGLVRTKASLVKHIIICHAPWNCRSIETQARGTHTHAYIYHCLRQVAPPELPQPVPQGRGEAQDAEREVEDGAQDSLIRVHATHNNLRS